MILETFAVGTLGCNCTILGDEGSGDAIVVDGGDGVDQVIEHLARHALRATTLVHTHAHIDHIADVGRLRECTHSRAVLHPADLPLYRTLPLQAQWVGRSSAPPVAQLDGDLRDGDRFRVGNVELEVLHTLPGV